MLSPPSERPARFGMGGHQGPILKDEWLTPPELINALGPFDLDPCAPINRPWPTATTHYTVRDDGLAQPWHGFVWLNPPYGQHTGSWLEKLMLHNHGIALIFARTETYTWHTYVWAVAHSVLFLHGRLNFHHVSGQRARHNAGAPSALVAYGAMASVRLRTSHIAGRIIRP